MSLNCTIQPNPDIAGIGIRISIYAQALLTLIPLGLSVLTRGKKNFFQPDLKPNSIALLTTGFAILVSAFIQAAVYGMDVYHALIVLNLSWLNNLAGFVPLAITAFGEAPDIADANPWKEVLISPFTLHLTATGAYGIWLFCKIKDFGTQPECNDMIVWVAAGHPVSSTSGSLRAFFLTVSVLAALPPLNFLVMFLVMCVIGYGFFYTLVHFIRLPQPLAAVGLVFAWMVPDLLIIIGTEQIVEFNQDQVGNGESAWTFGQTLALLMLILPAWSIVTHLWKAISRPLLTPPLEERIEALEKAGLDLEKEIRALKYDNRKEATASFMRWARGTGERRPERAAVRTRLEKELLQSRITRMDEVINVAEDRRRHLSSTAAARTNEETAQEPPQEPTTAVGQEAVTRTAEEGTAPTEEEAAQPPAEESPAARPVEEVTVLAPVEQDPAARANEHGTVSAEDATSAIPADDTLATSPRDAALPAPPTSPRDHAVPSEQIPAGTSPAVAEDTAVTLTEQSSDAQCLGDTTGAMPVSEDVADAAVAKRRASAEDILSPTPAPPTCSTSPIHSGLPALPTSPQENAAATTQGTGRAIAKQKTAPAAAETIAATPIKESTAVSHMEEESGSSRPVGEVTGMISVQQVSAATAAGGRIASSEDMPSRTPEDKNPSMSPSHAGLPTPPTSVPENDVCTEHETGRIGAEEKTTARAAVSVAAAHAEEHTTVTPAKDGAAVTAVVERKRTASSGEAQSTTIRQRAPSTPPRDTVLPEDGVDSRSVASVQLNEAASKPS